MPTKKSSTLDRAHQPVIAKPPAPRKTASGLGAVKGTKTSGGTKKSGSGSGSRSGY